MKTQLPDVPTPQPLSPTARQGLFPMTQWSMISDARGSDDGRVVRGLRDLATGYWRPLYLYLRKRGENHEDASDSVQGFFEFVFSSGFLSHIDREGGKFRSYLLKSLERWRSGRRVYNGAQKRGGQVEHVPLDGVDEFREIVAESVGDKVPAELAFDRQWAIDMVSSSVDALRHDYERRGRGEWFSALAPSLPGGGELDPYPELAQRLGAKEGTVRKAVFDLRSAFAEKLREAIRSTVRSNEDAEEELAYLISVMRGG
jgi:RNA polymerase sigma-70 factor (ECF subfamily)